MYSWEIDAMMKRKNYELTVPEFLEVTDTFFNPQISRIKLEYGTHYYMATHDGYEWSFCIKE